jgi:hypothetical protein
VAGLPGAEAELALPRGREKQAALVEAPAAEHASHFQPLDSTKSVLGVDANLVFHPAHNGRLPAAPATSASCGGAPLSIIRQYIEQQNRPG